MAFGTRISARITRGGLLLDVFREGDGGLILVPTVPDWELNAARAHRRATRRPQLPQTAVDAQL